MSHRIWQRSIASACLACAMGVPICAQAQSPQMMIQRTPPTADMANKAAGDPEPDAYSNGIISGTISLKSTATLVSSLPASTVIMCTLTVNLASSDYQKRVTESKSVPATRSGKTATCTVVLPYAWSVGSDPSKWGIDVESLITTASESPTAVSRLQSRTLGHYLLSTLIANPTLKITITPTL